MQAYAAPRPPLLRPSLCEQRLTHVILTVFDPRRIRLGFPNFTIVIEFGEPRVGKLDVPVEEVGEHPIRFFDSDGTSRSDQHSAIHEEHTICRSRTLKA